MEVYVYNDVGRQLLTSVNIRWTEQESGKHHHWMGWRILEF